MNQCKFIFIAVRKSQKYSPSSCKPPLKLSVIFEEPYHVIYIYKNLWPIKANLN